MRRAVSRAQRSSAAKRRRDAILRAPHRWVPGNSDNFGEISQTAEGRSSLNEDYCVIELATSEKTLLELPPIKRIVPTTITSTTANMTAYSAMSWPRSSDHNLFRNRATTGLLAEHDSACNGQTRSAILSPRPNHGGTRTDVIQCSYVSFSPKVAQWLGRAGDGTKVLCLQGMGFNGKD